MAKIGLDPVHAVLLRAAPFPWWREMVDERNKFPKWAILTPGPCLDTELAERQSPGLDPGFFFQVTFYYSNTLANFRFFRQDSKVHRLGRSGFYFHQNFYFF